MYFFWAKYILNRSKAEIKWPCFFCFVFFFDMKRIATFTAHASKICTKKYNLTSDLLETEIKSCENVGGTT